MEDPNLPPCCQSCNAQYICDCNQFYLACPHGKEMVEYRANLKKAPQRQ